MPSTTPARIITSALEDLGVLAIGETPEAALMQQGLRRLNQVIRSLGLERLAIPYRSREVFPLVTNQGTEASPYTIGPGGDFDTTRPDNIDGAGIVYPQSGDTHYEVPIGLYTEHMYQQETTKDLTSTFPESILYRRTFADGLGRIITWPVPNNDDYSLAIYRWQQLAEVAETPAGQTTEIDLPVSYDELLEYELACRWAPSFQKACPPEILQYAQQTKGRIKTANLAANMGDLGSDAGFACPVQYPNIFTGQGL